MPQYDPLIEVSARRDLNGLPPEERETLRRVLKDVAATEQPTHHPKVKPLSGFREVFRVRVSDARAVCKLDKPYLLILRVDKRSCVYDDIDELDVTATADGIEV